jgi:hypothetical protein
MVSLLDHFFANLTGAQRLLAFILLVTLVTILVAFVAGGWKTGIPVGVIVLTLLWLTGPLWKPEPSKKRFLLSSLSVTSAVALAIAGKSPEVKSVLIDLVVSRLHVPHEAAHQLAASDRMVSASVPKQEQPCPRSELFLKLACRFGFSGRHLPALRHSTCISVWWITSTIVIMRFQSQNPTPKGRWVKWGRFAN